MFDIRGNNSHLVVVDWLNSVRTTRTTVAQRGVLMRPCNHKIGSRCSECQKLTVVIMSSPQSNPYSSIVLVFIQLANPRDFHNITLNSFRIQIKLYNLIYLHKLIY